MYHTESENLTKLQLRTPHICGENQAVPKLTDGRVGHHLLPSITHILVVFVVQTLPSDFHPPEAQQRQNGCPRDCELFDAMLVLLAAPTVIGEREPPLQMKRLVGRC